MGGERVNAICGMRDAGGGNPARIRSMVAWLRERFFQRGGVEEDGEYKNQMADDRGRTSQYKDRSGPAGPKREQVLFVQGRRVAAGTHKVSMLDSWEFLHVDLLMG